MNKKQKALLVRKTVNTLANKYPSPEEPEPVDPLEQLLGSIISCDSRPECSAKALELFEEEFVDWNEVRVSSIAEIAGVLRQAGVDVEQARTIKSVLSQLFLKKNQLSMEFLRKYKEKQAEDFLNRFVGLNPAVVDEVMLLSLGHHRFPVNRDVLRVCRHLGIVTDEGQEETRALLMSSVPKSLMKSAYFLFCAHARAKGDSLDAAPAKKTAKSKKAAPKKKSAKSTKAKTKKKTTKKKAGTPAKKTKKK